MRTLAPSAGPRGSCSYIQPQNYTHWYLYLIEKKMILVRIQSGLYFSLPGALAGMNVVLLPATSPHLRYRVPIPRGAELRAVTLKPTKLYWYGAELRVLHSNQQNYTGTHVRRTRISLKLIFRVYSRYSRCYCWVSPDLHTGS